MAINNDAQELQRYDTQLSYASLSNPERLLQPVGVPAQHLTEKTPACQPSSRIQYHTRIHP